MATKKKVVKPQPQPVYFNPESDATRLSRLRQDLFNSFVNANGKGYGTDKGLTRAEAELFAKDSVVIADILFVGNK